MKVLVACEFSGIESRAFRRAGCEAWSCDVLPTEGAKRWHLQCDVREVLDRGWDLMVAHPPCTHLAVSGARWFKEKRREQEDALAFVRTLLDASIPRIALENPISIISSRIRRPDQIVQPAEFGHPETKATCLWLKNLPGLVPTDPVFPLEHRIHRMPPGPDRWRERSRSFTGIAQAMAAQWGSLPALTSEAA